MGQKGYFGYLKHTLKYEGKLVDLADCTCAKWDIDLLGSYSDFIRANTSEDLSTDGFDLGVRLGHHMRDRHTPIRSTIYMDGATPDQKLKANTQRTKEGRKIGRRSTHC
jgi:hypothetical protein